MTSGEIEAVRLRRAERAGDEARLAVLRADALGRVARQSRAVDD